MAAKLINEFAKQGHPLGRSISEEEIPNLIEALRQRLGTSGRDLDLSPKSLKRLEQCLVELHQKMQAQQLMMSDEEVVRLVREVAAYVGQVLVVHAGGQWSEETKTLWGSEVVIEGPWEVIKDRRFTSPYPTHFIMGGGAALAWDAITAGKRPNLYRLYREARDKRIRENL